MSEYKNNIEKIKALKDRTKGMRVLVVEDDLLLQEMYENFFLKFFEDIQIKENGKEGFDAFMKKSYDIVITDLEMPLMNGLDMIQAMKEINPKQHTILVSAHQDASYLSRAIELGVDGYLFKPIDIENSIRTFEKIVSQIETTRENLVYKENLEQLVEQKSKELVDTYTIDPITKLFTIAKLQQDIKSLRECSLGIFKIKNFKALNDFHGYEVGNELLRQTADFLKEAFRETLSCSEEISLYRVSGTHFGILAPIDAKDLEVAFKHIIRSYEATEMHVNRNAIYLEMNAAIVGRENEITLSYADTALRLAEKSSKVIVYKRDEILLKEHENKLLCDDAIKRALQDDRFVPFYHPIVENATNSICKYEALARMVMPDGEVVYPDCFLPVSKQTKNYNAITRAIIKQALHDFRDSECSVSVNISIDDIQHKPTSDFIFDQIMNFPEPSRIVFELLESENIGSYEEVKKFFCELKKCGCKVAIDDFGSGYANFEHIAKLEVDYIKIDGSLILGIENELSSYAIVEMLADFSKKMGIKTIAEYVSSDSIQKIVDTLGISESQGFLYGEPIPYDVSMKSRQSV